MKNRFLYSKESDFHSIMSNINKVRKSFMSIPHAVTAIALNMREDINEL